MRAADVMAEHDLVVSLVYGQFLLRGDELDDPAVETRLCSEALAGEGIASEASAILVLSPHQANSEMPLRIEVWNQAPADDVDDWEEAFEAGLDVRDGDLTYEAPTLYPHRRRVPPGRYQVLITGRGFVSRGWPGSTTPGDHWRVRLWPASGIVPARRLRAWAG